MAARKVVMVAALLVSTAAVFIASGAYAQESSPCQVIGKYLSQVEEFSTFSFGDDREKKLREAQKAYHDQLAALKYSPSNELTELIASYVSQTSLGHDRMRKGDANLLVKARDTYEKIKSHCPW